MPQTKSPSLTPFFRLASSQCTRWGCSLMFCPFTCPRKQASTPHPLVSECGSFCPHGVTLVLLCPHGVTLVLSAHTETLVLSAHTVTLLLSAHTHCDPGPLCSHTLRPWSSLLTHTVTLVLSAHTHCDPGPLCSH